MFFTVQMSCVSLVSKVVCFSVVDLFEIQYILCLIVHHIRDCVPLVTITGQLFKKLNIHAIHIPLTFDLSEGLRENQHL